MMTKEANKMKYKIGKAVSAIWILFLLFDAVMKIIKHPVYVKSTMELGFKEAHVPMIGAILFLCTLLYIIPKTRKFGLLLLTMFLGGAVAIELRVSHFAWLFPAFFILALWIAEYLKDKKLIDCLSRS